jgi:MFS family permease
MNDATRGPDLGRAAHDRAPPDEKAERVVDIPSWNVDPATPLYRIRPIALLFTTRVASNVTNHMITVAVGYQVYDLTESASLLGLIGLAQFLPPMLLMLFAGQVSDRFNRRQVLRICYAIEFCAAVGFVVLALLPQPSIPLIFLFVFINATARTFELPAVAALMPLMAPRAVLGRAIAAHVSAGKLSMLIGPSFGGVLYLFGPYVVYGTCVLTILTAAGASFLLPKPPDPAGPSKFSLGTLLAGFRFMWRCEVLLGAMSLDLVATLFGGLQALLPIYARDILDIGPLGAGVLRSAPAVGALLAAAVLARVPITRHAGIFMYAGVVIYGASAIVFAFSHNAILSIAMLSLFGAGDMVSAVVRQTLMQVTTPDDMRGRVSAVSSLFASTSDQLGWFRAGMMAAALGPVGSVAIGGVAAIATVAVWNWRFPVLRHVQRPDEVQPSIGA